MELSKFIGKGATRICFEHPENPNKCVKVTVRYKQEYLLTRELEAYKKIKPYLNEYLLQYDEELLPTNLGNGLVCELLRNDHGGKVKNLYHYMVKNSLDEELKNQVKDFTNRLIKNNIFFYDFNAENFLVKETADGHKKLYYTDLKSYNNYKPWTFLKLEKIFYPLAKYLMKQRLKRLFTQLHIKM